MSAQPWVVPASYAQERVWLASQVAADVPLFHVVDRVRLPYALDADAVLACLATVVERHETLRTAFRVDGGQLMQVVHDTVELPVDHLDLSGLDEVAQSERIARRLEELAHADLPLERAPLWRATLVRLGPASWCLLVVAHHAVVDAASQLNLYAELTECAAAAAGGRAPRLPELSIQYADYAAWERERLQGGELARLLEYWRRTLHDLPPVHGVPTDRPRPAQRTFAGDEVRFTLPEELATAVPALARTGAASPFMVLLTAYVALVHQLAGAPDVVVGVPVSGRDRPELEPLIGMFINMVVVRVDAGGDPTFAELLGRVRDQVLAAWEHREMPFQRLVEEFAVRDPRVPPLYQLGFNHLPVGSGTTFGTAEDDLMLEIADREGRLEYNSGLFDPGSAQRLVDDFVRLLAAGVADPGGRLSALPAAAGTTGVRYVSTTPGGAEADGFIAPRTEAEKVVADVWAEVLGVERIGAHDEFFALGGHSLLALRVIARLAAVADVDVPIQAFFADTTVAGVAAELERRLAAELAGAEES